MKLERTKIGEAYWSQRESFASVPYPDMSVEERVALFHHHMTIPLRELQTAAEQFEKENGFEDATLSMALDSIYTVERNLYGKWLKGRWEGDPKDLETSRITKVEEPESGRTRSLEVEGC